MITTAAKWFFGLGLVSYTLAVVYGYSTGGNRLGPFTAGYYGSVGDHLGYTILLTLSLGTALLGLVAVLSRDADPRALAALAGTDDAPEAARLLGAADTAARALAVELEPLELELHARATESLQETLGRGQFADAHAAGQMLTLDAAVERALSAQVSTP